MAKGQVYYINFYPRSPCGERRRKAFSIFLPIRISIHALLAESDGFGLARLVAYVNFYPRSPCGERLPALHHVLKLFPISIHALLAESDPHPKYPTEYR